MRSFLSKMKQGVFAGMLILIVCGVAWGGGDSTSPQKTGESQDFNMREGLDNEQIKVAKSLVAHFAASAKCKQIPGVLRPQLPDVPVEVCQAIDVLCKAKDKDVIADIAAVLVRYARVNEDYGTGAHVDRKHPLAKAFLFSMNPKLPGDEIISYSLAEWICKNRHKMGRSVALDKEIDEYNKLSKRLQIKYERMQQDALESIGGKRH